METTIVLNKLLNRLALGFLGLSVGLILFAGSASADTIEWDATLAEKDPVYGVHNGFHAIWLPGLDLDSADWVFEGNGLFVEESDKSEAWLTGTIKNSTNANNRFAVNMHFTELTAGVVAKKELTGAAYSPGSGGINTASWHYYELGTAVSLTGLGDYTGLNLSLSHKPEDSSMGFQVGYGANGKNLLNGMSGWFSWTADAMPTGWSGATSGGGDVNIDINPVPEPGSIALLGLGLVGLGFVSRRRKAKAS